MLVRVVFVFWVGVFAVEQAQGWTIKTSGEISLSAIGKDCGALIGGSQSSRRYRATLVQKKEGEGLSAPRSYKLMVQLADGSTETLSAFKVDAADVLPASGGEEIIGRVRAVDSARLAITVRYDTDGNGKGDEVWFSSVGFPYPYRVVVSGSRAGRERNCVVNWFGTLTETDQD